MTDLQRLPQAIQPQGRRDLRGIVVSWLKLPFRRRSQSILDAIGIPASLDPAVSLEYLNDLAFFVMKKVKKLTDFITTWRNFVYTPPESARFIELRRLKN